MIARQFNIKLHTHEVDFTEMKSERDRDVKESSHYEVLDYRVSACSECGMENDISRDFMIEKSEIAVGAVCKG